MTGGGKIKAAGDGGTIGKLTLQRIRVKADGYDATGTYWGAGPDVYIATTPDGATEITVRAKTVTEARKKAAAELARPAGSPRSTPREQLGGAAPTSSRYEIDWRDPVTDETVRLKITHSRDYLGQGQDHVEVESIAPAKAPLPITETGYRSNFIASLELMNDGGPVTFVTAWLDCEARGKDWQKVIARKRQRDLFQWADTQVEVGERKSAKSATPAAKPRARPRPKTTPQ
jgi:hypothetical protein